VIQRPEVCRTVPLTRRQEGPDRSVGLGEPANPVSRPHEIRNQLPISRRLSKSLKGGMPEAGLGRSWPGSSVRHPTSPGGAVPIAVQLRGTIEIRKMPQAKIIVPQAPPSHPLTEYLPPRSSLGLSLLRVVTGVWVEHHRGSTHRRHAGESRAPGRTLDVVRRSA
jgi:hypothetical protein